MTSIVPFQQLARLCAKKGIRNVIVCPGSRNAALSIAFTKEKDLNCISLSDERSAAYVAVGMSLQSGGTTVLICTSGTAVLNFAPAIAEAFFQEVPLLILTADRPPEWIHQYDGQTIFQEAVYGKHVKKSLSWSADQSAKNLQAAENVSIEAIDLSQTDPKGPVHINIPIREPFYPNEIKELETEWNTEQIESKSPQEEYKLRQMFSKELKSSSKRLLLVGQQHSKKLRKLAGRFAEKFGFTLIGDCISNVNGNIQNHDFFLLNEDQDLVPDFLISLDKSLISKKLKLFLRNNEIDQHWHVQDNPAFIDPFRSLQKKIVMNAEEFLEELLNIDTSSEQMAYQGKWEKKNKEAKTQIDLFFKKKAYSEFHFLKEFIAVLPSESTIHVGNSMSIRYLNAMQSYLPQAKVYCNRGTSGIDGSLSTAVGQAMCTNDTVYCVLGDVSFQYDKNALWTNYLPNNLKIIILNNAGGIIFKMISGPDKQESFDEFFHTKQRNKADLIATEYGLNYFSIRNQAEISVTLERFIASPESSILEIFSDSASNAEHYKAFLKGS